MSNVKPLIVFFQGNTSSFHHHKRFTSRTLPSAQRIDPLRFIQYNADLEEVVYWNDASWKLRLLLFPWFLFNYLRYVFCYLFHPNCSRPVSPIHAIKWWLMNVGQYRDLMEHQQRLAISEKKFPGCRKIAWGVSRGAATTFCSFARFNETYKNIGLVVLEGCFDSVPSVLEQRYGKTLAWIGERFLSYFTEYDMEKAHTDSPLALAKNFPHHLPVAFITSKADNIVAYDCTMRLYNAVVASGHPKVHLLILEDKGHNEYYTGQDAVTYHQFLELLVQKYFNN